MESEMAVQENTPPTPNPLANNPSSGVDVPPPPAATVPPVVSPPPPPVKPQPAGDIQGQPPQAQQPPAPKRRISKRLLKIIGAVVLALVLILTIIRLVMPRIGSEQEKTLTWWGLWEDSSIVQPLLTEYEATTGVKVNYVKQSHKDYRERLTNALARGEGPDLFRFHNSWVPMFKGELDTVPASVMSPAEFAETFYPVALRDLSSGSGLVGIPLEYDGLTLFINQDIFDSEEKQPPATWDDLRELAIEMTRKDEQGVITRAGVALGRTENVDHWQEILALMMVQNGARLANPTGPLAEDALTFFTVFSQVDGVWDETLPSSTVAFAAGKVAMYFAPSWRAFEITQQNPDLKFKTVELPQLPKEVGTEPDVAYATYWAEGVWARSENKEEAWAFLKYLSTKENLQKLYQSASKVRSFGEPYSRVDMASLLTDHPVLGSIIELAPDAESWYLADRTFDGPTGLNSQLGAYFEDAVNAVNQKQNIEETLLTAAQGVVQVLSQYGITR